MKSMSIRILCVAVFATISGCANFNTAFRDLDVDSGKGAMIDIKQRAVLVSKRSDKVVNQGRMETVSRTVVCAEPSPDALSAYAAELAGKVDSPSKVSAQLGASFQEGASYIGLRTQSIQLLRDSLYRLCEGYMSGALDTEEYSLLARRYQKYMLALLAIEQLTGVIKVPPVSINTSGQADAAKSLSVLRSEEAKLDDAIKAQDENIVKAGLGEDEKKKISNDIVRLKGDKKVIQDAIANAKDLAVNGASVVAVHGIGMPSQRSDDHVKAVASTVGNIVSSFVAIDDFPQLCFSHLKSVPVGFAQDQLTPLQAACLSRIQSGNEALKVEMKAIQQMISSADSKTESGRKTIQAAASRAADMVKAAGLLSVRKDLSLPTD
ncbi:hypothetical protein [Azohydromonas caseinilytica]|uniref:Lipoprotein n=1 Tax=Azohydromonas caseinilytica TaxID=2728836 RepID=A0A848F967_9BURK|nr:hypothetical protein [Azohydromonas caseinilytica]NML15029.1 hypothetical protein [Azohydromonas caseinilytica]